jgi:hypothetical protein
VAAEMQAFSRSGASTMLGLVMLWHTLEDGGSDDPQSTPWTSRCGRDMTRRRARSGVLLPFQSPLGRPAHRRRMGYQFIAQLSFERDSLCQNVPA